MAMRQVLAAVLLCCTASFCSIALAEDHAPGRIHVAGQGSATLAPDMASLSLTVTREGNTASEALAANNEAMKKVMDAMRSAGVAEKDLQTSNFDISPRYVHPDPRSGNDEQGPRIVGYRVRNGLMVTVRDIGKVGTLLDAAVRQGVNEGGQISLGNADPGAALDQARTLAMQDALSRASVLAKAAGVQTGDIIEIQEQNSHSRPSPAPMYRMNEMAMADSVPVASGEHSYEVTVNLTIAIEP